MSFFQANPRLRLESEPQSTVNVAWAGCDRRARSGRCDGVGASERRRLSAPAGRCPARPDPRRWRQAVMTMLDIGHVGIGDVLLAALRAREVPPLVQVDAAGVHRAGQRADEMHQPGSALPARVGHAEQGRMRYRGCSGHACHRRPGFESTRVCGAARDVACRWCCRKGQAQGHDRRWRSGRGSACCARRRRSRPLVDATSRAGRSFSRQGWNVAQHARRRRGWSADPANAKGIGSRGPQAARRRPGCAWPAQCEQHQQMHEQRCGDRHGPWHGLAERCDSMYAGRDGPGPMTHPFSRPCPGWRAPAAAPGCRAIAHHDRRDGPLPSDKVSRGGGWCGYPQASSARLREMLRDDPDAGRRVSGARKQWGVTPTSIARYAREPPGARGVDGRFPFTPDG